MMFTKIPVKSICWSVSALLPLQLIHAKPKPKVKPKSNLPNIVLIYTDDQGYGDLGCYGAKGFNTPNIDSLANNGIRFTNFYAPQAVSSASRAGLLTGCYPNRIGIASALTPNSKKGLGKTEVTIAELLRAKGYATGMFGKWHLGAKVTQLPTEHGFDTWSGIPYSVDMIPMDYDGTTLDSTSHKQKYPLLPVYNDTAIISRLNTLPGIDTLTQYLTKKSVDFIHKNNQKPFFLYIPHPMPHTPLGVSITFKNSSQQGKYGDVMQELDWSVGEIVDALRKDNLLENTIIIYSSDNGPWRNFGMHAGLTGGLREGKGTTWEGGQRVPCVVYWKNHFPSQVSDEISSAIDILPTIADLTNSELPPLKIDGVSLKEVLFNNKNAHPRNQFWYYYENNQLQAIRFGDWKRIYPHLYRTYYDEPLGENGMPGENKTRLCGDELYDLKSDSSESKNLFYQYPEIVKQLDSIAEIARMELGDALQKRKGAANRDPDGVAVEKYLEFKHLAFNATVDYLQAFSEQYTGFDKRSLTNGILGNDDYSNRSWQGFNGNDVEVTLDMHQTQSIHQLKMNFIKDESAWIFLPLKVQAFYSNDRINFEALGEFSIANEANKLAYKTTYLLQKNIQARYLKIKAENRKICPPNHAGAGKPAWLFTDEIVVE